MHYKIIKDIEKTLCDDFQLPLLHQYKIVLRSAKVIELSHNIIKHSQAVLVIQNHELILKSCNNLHFWGSQFMEIHYMMIFNDNDFINTNLFEIKKVTKLN